jgi:hypothetical protein
MKLPPFVPKPADVGYQALLMIGASLVAAYILNQLPATRDYLRRAGF